jgi:hypothetical protein
MNAEVLEPPSSPPCLTNQPRSQKRRALDLDFGFPSSDGPAFSSDPPEPAIDEHRRKRQHRGTWWSHGSGIQPLKSSLSRNFDSGIYLPSDSSEESDSKAATISLKAHSYRSRRIAIDPQEEDPSDVLAWSMVNAVVESNQATLDMR